MWFQYCGLNRIQELSFIQNLLHLGDFLGTLCSSRRKILFTRLWFTRHPLFLRNIGDPWKTISSVPGCQLDDCFGESFLTIPDHLLMLLNQNMQAKILQARRSETLKRFTIIISQAATFEPYKFSFAASSRTCLS